MRLFSFLKRNDDQSPRTWRDAANRGGYGIKVPTPKRPTDLHLCSHLAVSEKTRRTLEAFITKHFFDRPEGLANEFLQLAGSPDIFPTQLVEICRNRKPRTKGDSFNKYVASVYIRHEQTRLRTTDELKKFTDLKLKLVRIRTSEDARVCDVCKTHADTWYPISQTPMLPLCWECHCYYEPMVE